MWGLMNTALGTMRHRRGHRNGMGTMTALVVGASVGIAAWEAMRKTQGSGKSENGTSSGTASTIAEDVMREIES